MSIGFKLSVAAPNALSGLAEPALLGVIALRLRVAVAEGR